MREDGYDFACVETRRRNAREMIAAAIGLGLLIYGFSIL